MKTKRLASLDGGVLAGVAGAGADLGGLLAAVVALELRADLLDGGGAGAGDGGGVAVVGVDTGEELSAIGLDVLDGDSALAHLLAVAARAVELAEGVDSEAVNGDRANTVVLDDLVISTLGTTADDLGAAVALEGKSVLADVDPPDVLDGAAALAVDTLDLVGANDGVLQGGAVLKDENGIAVTTLGLTSALDTTAVGLQTTVEGAGDGLGRAVLDGALGGGDGEARTANKLLRGSVEVGRGGEGGSRQEGKEDKLGEHFEL